MADSPEGSFSCTPLDPLKGDFKTLECLITPPGGIYCAPLKIEAHQMLTQSLGAEQALAGGRALPHPHGEGS